MQDKTVNVLGVFLGQTGTYQNQVRRPLYADVSGDAISDLSQAVQGGSRLNVDSVQNAANKILKPLAEPEGEAQIANTWQERRFRMVLKVMEQEPFHKNYVQRIIYGYTDKCDASYGRSLDPDMRIYFNSESKIAVEQIPTETGPVTRTRPMGNNQIVGPYQMADQAPGVMGMLGGPSNYLLRPSDLYDVRHAETSAQKMQYGMANSDAVITASAQAANGATPRLVDRNYSSPARYMERTLKGMYHAVQEAAQDPDGDQESLLSAASDHLSPQLMFHSDFFDILKQYTGYYQRGYVTWRELLQVFPEANDRTDAYINDLNELRRMSGAGDSEHWNGQGNTTVAATLIGQVVPSLMMDSYLRTVMVTAENGQGLSNYNIHPEPHNTTFIVDGTDGQFQQNQIMEFLRRLATDVLDGMTHRNQLPFFLTIHADLVGETVINITLDGDGPVRFVVPSFSDALFSQQATLDENYQRSMADHMTYLAQEVIPTVSHNTSAGLLGSDGRSLLTHDTTNWGGQPTHNTGLNDDTNHYPGLL